MQPCQGADDSLGGDPVVATLPHRPRDPSASQAERLALRHEIPVLRHQVGHFVYRATTETLLARHRRLVTVSGLVPTGHGRPPVVGETSGIVVHMASENRASR
jgi:hypothetical protein